MIMQNQLVTLRTRAGAIAGYSVIGIILIALAVIGILYLFGRAGCHPRRRRFADGGGDHHAIDGKTGSQRGGLPLVVFTRHGPWPVRRAIHPLRSGSVPRPTAPH